MLHTWPLLYQRHTQHFVFLRPLWEHKTPGGNTLPTTYDSSVPDFGLAPSAKPLRGSGTRNPLDI